MKHKLGPAAGRKVVSKHVALIPLVQGELTLLILSSSKAWKYSERLQSVLQAPSMVRSCRQSAWRS